MQSVYRWIEQWRLIKQTLSNAACWKDVAVYEHGVIIGTNRWINSKGVVHSAVSKFTKITHITLGVFKRVGHTNNCCLVPCV